MDKSIVAIAGPHMITAHDERPSGVRDAVEHFGTLFRCESTLKPFNISMVPRGALSADTPNLDLKRIFLLELFSLA